MDINKELSLYIEKNIFPKYERYYSHGMIHINNVIKNMLMLAEYYNLNKNMAYVIAAFHDIGLNIDRKNHEYESGKILNDDIELKKYFNEEEGDNLESFTICALLHDICKAQYYKTSTRNQKNEETGQWEKVPYYSVEDLFPYGHGEKSVFLIERFMRLKLDEAMAIRWHMGGFDDSARAGGYAMSQAFEKYTLAVKLHLADLHSTYLNEKGTSSVR